MRYLIETLVSFLHNILFYCLYKTIITTTNDPILRVLTSEGHRQVTVRLTDVSVVCLLTCRWLVYSTSCVVVGFAFSVGVFLCLCFVFSVV
jgi:hypothetical protein